MKCIMEIIPRKHKFCNVEKGRICLAAWGVNVGVWEWPTVKQSERGEEEFESLKGIATFLNYNVAKV